MDDILLFAFFSLFLAFLLSLIKATSTDSCLRHFSGDFVVLQLLEDQSYSGELWVASSGMELVNLEGGERPLSFLFYSQEYPKIHYLIRYTDYLDEHAERRRNRRIQEIYQPTWGMRWKRKILSVFKLARDGFFEIINLLFGYVKRMGMVGKISSTEKAKEIGTEVVNFFGTSYDPLLERHIGHRMVVEIVDGENICGILSDYTAAFLELLDVKLAGEERVCDVIIRRGLAIPRHLAERPIPTVPRSREDGC